MKKIITYNNITIVVERPEETEEQTKREEQVKLALMQVGRWENEKEKIQKKT